MQFSDPNNYIQSLNLARKGDGILFCGAGFSADCLNFEPNQTLGTGAQLLALFNEKLGISHPFKDLRNAADKLEQEIGENGLMQLLKEKFRVAEVTDDMVDILRFPWSSVYTTNYDNAIEISAQRAKCKYRSINNSEDLNTKTTCIPIIHLHGFFEKWDLKNFNDSCVLTADSYRRLTRVKAWLKRFRDEIDRSNFVAFIGFSAEDLHINNFIYDITGLREKTIFINQPRLKFDPDLDANQSRLGKPYYCGRNKFARDISELLKKSTPDEPRLSSFQCFKSPPPAPGVPKADSIEELFIYGKQLPGQLARDVTDGVSDYHLNREIVDQVLEKIQDGAKSILLTGFTCDGKSLILNDLLLRLSKVRPCYNLIQHYDTLLDEVARIIDFTPNAVLTIENCFDLSSERLNSIAAQFHGQDRILLLTSRKVSTEASGAGLQTLKNFDDFFHITLPNLTGNEADQLVELVDRIAGWRKFFTGSITARRNFILKTCEGSLPNFLLRMLNSIYVRDRYREEFSKISLGTKERDVVITALYIAHIGEIVPTAFISNFLEVDSGEIIDNLNDISKNEGFHLVRRKGQLLETVPSIGAKNILSILFDDRDIVDTIVLLLKTLAETYPRNDFENFMLKQMLRYTILNGVVEDKSQINRFFDNNTQLNAIRRMPLFWLQWHMSKVDVGDYVNAEKYLEQGYKEARDYERRTTSIWNKKQLDDRRAKFLMIRAANTDKESGELYRDFCEAFKLTAKLFHEQDLAHYPYETLYLIAKAFEKKKLTMSERLQNIIFDSLLKLKKTAESRLSVVLLGYSRSKAEKTLSHIESIVSRLQTHSNPKTDKSGKGLQ